MTMFYIPNFPFYTMYGEMTQLPADFSLPLAKYTEDDAIVSQVIKGGTYLPRIQLCGGNSNICKEGKIGVGRYGLIASKDEVIDLTNQFDCLPLVWRFLAMRIADGNVLSYFNPKTEQFKKLMHEADNVKDSGCMYGMEFMLWVPTLNRFTVFFFNSKTARRQAPNMRALCENKDAAGNRGLPKAATMKVEFIKNKKYSWHGCIVVPCSTPFPLPDPTAIQEQAILFANPSDSTVEKVDATTPTDGGEERPQ